MLTPVVRAVGAYENGWQYILMSRLRGENFAHSWEHVPQEHRERLVVEIGQPLASLHSLSPEPLRDALGPEDWGTFLDRRTAGAVERQRVHGLSAAWLEEIPDFLASAPLPRAPQPSLLHTEVMQQHFLVDPAGWRMTGLSDFEPAMIGDRAYDLVGVGLFVTYGNAALLARLTEVYGNSFERCQ